jgi:hypothetical protein
LWRKPKKCESNFYLWNGQRVTGVESSFDNEITTLEWSEMYYSEEIIEKTRMKEQKGS